MQSVYFLPKESRVSEGEELSLTVCHDNYSLWYGLQSHRYFLSLSLSPAVLKQQQLFYLRLYILQNSESLC